MGVGFGPSSRSQRRGRHRDPAPWPLPKNYFRALQLAPSSTATYDALRASMLQQALTRAHNARVYGGVDDSWTDLGAEHGFSRHRKLETGATLAHFHVQGVVAASTEALMSVLHCDDDEDVVRRRSLLFGAGLDAQTLAVLRDDRDVHTAMRWEAFALHAMDTSRFQCDAVLLESMGVTVDEDGVATGYLLSQTVELPTCPPLQTSHGVTRLAMMESVLLRPISSQDRNAPPSTEVIVEGCIELPPTIPVSVTTSLTSAIAQHLQHLPQVVRSRQLAQLRVLERKFWVRTSARRNCSACLRKFGLLSRKHHCRACGEVICGACAISRSAAERVKFCRLCAATVSGGLPNDGRYTSLYQKQQRPPQSQPIPSPTRSCDMIETDKVASGPLARSCSEGPGQQVAAWQWLEELRHRQHGHVNARTTDRQAMSQSMYPTTKTRFCAPPERTTQTFATN